MGDNKWEFSWDWVDPILKEYIVPDKVRKQRQKTCKNCEELNKISVCENCGCFMPVKTLFKGFECPLGKWTALD